MVSLQVPFFKPVAVHVTEFFAVLHFSVFRVPLLTATAVYFTPLTRVKEVVTEFFVIRVFTLFGFAGTLPPIDAVALKRTRTVGVE